MSRTYCGQKSVLLFSALCLMISVGCKKPVVETGKLVKINYTLTVDGKVVDSSAGKQPLPYVQGNHQIIPGLEEQLAGLKVGDKKHIVVPPEKGYGPLRPDAEQKVPRSVFGKTEGLTVGMTVTGQNNGHPVRAKVVAIGPKEITLNFNHPLAGKTLTFDIEVVEISPAPIPSAPERMPSPAESKI